MGLQPVEAYEEAAQAPSKPNQPRRSLSKSILIASGLHCGSQNRRRGLLGLARARRRRPAAAAAAAAAVGVGWRGTAGRGEDADPRSGGLRPPGPAWQLDVGCGFSAGRSSARFACFRCGSARSSRPARICSSACSAPSPAATHVASAIRPHLLAEPATCAHRCMCMWPPAAALALLQPGPRVSSANAVVLHRAQAGTSTP